MSDAFKNFNRIYLTFMSKKEPIPTKIEHIVTGELVYIAYRTARYIVVIQV